MVQVKKQDVLEQEVLMEQEALMKQEVLLMMEMLWAYHCYFPGDPRQFSLQNTAIGPGPPASSIPASSMPEEDLKQFQSMHPGLDCH